MPNENNDGNAGMPSGPSEAVQNTLSLLEGLKIGDSNILSDLKKSGNQEPQNNQGNQGADQNKGQENQGNKENKPNPDEEGKNKEGSQEGQKEGAKTTEKKVEEIESPLFGKQVIGKKEAEQSVNFKEFSDIEKHIKSTFGADSVEKFIKEVAPKWREQAQNAAKLEKANKEVSTLFEQMPEQLFNAVKAFSEGRDYNEELAKAPALDFNKKVDSYDKKALIDHYYPGKFSKEDFDPDTENKAVDVAYEAAIKLFNSDKVSFDKKRAEMVDGQRKALQNYENSINSSVENLKKTLPFVNEMALKDVSETLKGGVNEILAEFVNSDGTLKEDAAQKMAMVKHGLATLDVYMKFAQNRSETEVREEFVSKGPDKINQNNNAGGDQKISDKAKLILDTLGQLNRPKTY